MKPSILAIVALILIALCSSRSAMATPGNVCFSDANCNYGEICIKEHSWSPNGVCIKGSR